MPNDVSKWKNGRQSRAIRVASKELGETSTFAWNSRVDDLRYSFAVSTEGACESSLRGKVAFVFDEFLEWEQAE